MEGKGLKVDISDTFKKHEFISFCTNSWGLGVFTKIWELYFVCLFMNRILRVIEYSEQHLDFSRKNDIFNNLKWVRETLGKCRQHWVICLLMLRIRLLNEYFKINDKFNSLI